MNGRSFEAVEGYMNFQGFIQLPPAGGSEGSNSLQSLPFAAGGGAPDQQPQQSAPNMAASANNSGAPGAAPPSRYESQKRRDWNTFGQYLRNHRPPLAVSKCSGAHVLEFLRYLDQFGKTKVHIEGCPYFGQPQPPAACACPLRQAWGSLDALIGRLRAAFEENGGKPESNPFGARAVRLYLRDVRETQAKARGIAYEKKKRKRHPVPAASSCASSTTNHPPPPHPHHHHHPHPHPHPHQATVSTSSSCSAPDRSSTLISSPAESVYPISSSIPRMGMTHRDVLHVSTGSAGHDPLPIDHHLPLYHHNVVHHIPAQAAPARPSAPPPLIPSFN